MASDFLGEKERRQIQQEMFQLEDQNLALEEQYQYLFENALSGLFRIDEEIGRVLTANKELLSIFKVEQLVELDYLLNQNGIFDELAELTNEKYGETVIFSSPLLIGSEERMIQFSARYQNKAGVIEGAARDITDLVKAEKRMLEAITEAEKANHAKSIFLANMSHEIRTPLNGIVGFAELIERESPPEQALYAKKILHESGRLMTLINQLLDISKIEANQVSLDSQPFSIRELVKEQFDSFLPQLNEKGLAWEINIEENVSDAYMGDAFRIGQVITNLLSNAVKFTSLGKISINISIEHVNKENESIRFVIQDSGIGIPPEKHEMVFEKFSQADNSIERRYGGTGLGIAICRELVELMGGSISLSSRPGQGTSLTFIIPLKKGNRGQDKANVNSHKVDTRLIPPSKILLVEDYKVNQDVMILQLKDYPLTIDVADNGAEAVKLFEQNSYDLILMDVHMPVMSGLEATKKMRTMKNGQDIPVIGMSASAFYTDKDECRRAGMNDFLSKPILRAKLVNHITYWLMESKEQNKGKEKIWNIEEEDPPTQNSSLIRFEEFCIELESSEDCLNIIEGFLNSSLILMNEIFKDIKSENWERAHRNAHSIKGGALNIMADELSERALKLESALKELPGHDIMPLYHSVSQSLERLRGEFFRIKEHKEG
jgi:two-component system sensor histidine kinase/response regulator